MGIFGTEMVNSSDFGGWNPLDLSWKPKTKETKMKQECNDIVSNTVLEIRQLEQLIDRRKHAAEFGFDARLAFSTLDSALNFMTKAGQKSNILADQVISFRKHVESLKGKMPAHEYISSDEAGELPFFDKLRDEFLVMAIESTVNCECHKKE